MYNKLFIPLQHSVEVVYFSIIIWYTFTLSFTYEEEGNQNAAALRQRGGAALGILKTRKYE